jgi:hypothetical protein
MLGVETTSGVDSERTLAYALHKAQRPQRAA